MVFAATTVTGVILPRLLGASSNFAPMAPVPIAVNEPAAAMLATAMPVMNKNLARPEAKRPHRIYEEPISDTIKNASPASERPTIITNASNAAKVARPIKILRFGALRGSTVATHAAAKGRLHAKKTAKWLALANNPTGTSRLVGS